MGLFDTELPIDEALPRLTAALRQLGEYRFPPRFLPRSRPII